MENGEDRFPHPTTGPVSSTDLQFVHRQETKKNSPNPFQSLLWLLGGEGSPGAPLCADCLGYTRTAPDPRLKSRSGSGSLVRSWLNWPPCWPCLPQPWPQGCPLHPTLPPTLSPRHGACLWLLAVSPHRIKDVLPLWGTRGWGTTAWQHSRGGHPRRPRTPAPSS